MPNKKALIRFHRESLGRGLFDKDTAVRTPAVPIPVFTELFPCLHNEFHRPDREKHYAAQKIRDLPIVLRIYERPIGAVVMKDISGIDMPICLPASTKILDVDMVEIHETE